MVQFVSYSYDLLVKVAEPGFGSYVTVDAARSVGRGFAYEQWCERGDAVFVEVRGEWWMARLNNKIWGCILRE